MPARKRGRAEMETAPELPPPSPPQAPSLLMQIRNRWEFANLVQYIYLFGDALKIDKEIDVEDIENEFLRTEPSAKLAEIGLCMLKFVSSNRGLTLEVFSEQMRRQYERKAPHLRNPFGQEEQAKSFHDLDVFTRLRILWQLSQWTLLTPERIREKMGSEAEDPFWCAKNWRCEEFGFDKDGRRYFVLDDNRLYRRTDAPPVVPARKPKANSKAGRSQGRANKKRKSNVQKEVGSDEGEEEEEEEEKKSNERTRDQEEDLWAEVKWECLAVSLTEYQDFVAKLAKSKNEDEKDLRNSIEEDILPHIVSAEEERQRKIRQKEKELLTQEKMTRAKRSSRIASKQEKEREAAEAEAAEQKRRVELAEANKIVDRQKRMEQDRQSRMLTREQRIKEREAKRVLEEQQLLELEEASEKGEIRVSERSSKAKIEQKRKAIEALGEEEPWFFDCSGCGRYGDNYDDGSHSVACEKCNVWQHSKCLGVSKAEAEKEDFHFVCADCKQREEDAKRPKIPPLKLKLGSSVSPPSNKNKGIKYSSDCIEVQVPKRNNFKVSTATSNSMPNHAIAVEIPKSRPSQTTTGLSSSPSAFSTFIPYDPNTSLSKHSPSKHASNSTAFAGNCAQRPSLPKPTSSSPPIGHFAPIARNNSISKPSSATPVVSNRTNPLPAYKSPWSQSNGALSPNGVPSNSIASTHPHQATSPVSASQNQQSRSPLSSSLQQNGLHSSMANGVSGPSQPIPSIAKSQPAAPLPLFPLNNGSMPSTSQSIQPGSSTVSTQPPHPQSTTTAPSPNVAIYEAPALLPTQAQQQPAPPPPIRST